MKCRKYSKAVPQTCVPFVIRNSIRFALLLAVLSCPIAYAADFTGRLTGVAITASDSDNQAPSAVIKFTQNEKSITFDASESTDVDGSIDAYQWDFGDGSTDSGVTVNHTYTSDGNFPVTLTVIDNQGGASIKQANIVHMVLDNGEDGTSSTGDWKVSGGSDPIGEGSLYSKTMDGTYMFETQEVAMTPVRVFIWSSVWPSRCTSVPIDIYDGEILVDTVIFNQLEESKQWKELGDFTFANNAKVVINVKDTVCSTCADAVKFVTQ